MRHAAVLKFPSPLATRRPLADTYPTDAVRTLIALAPELGRCNPDAVKTVETVMRNLIGTDGRGRDRAPAARRRRPAKARLPATTVTAVLERLGVGDAQRRAQLRPMIRAYLKGRPA
jgi:hypothetical protein